jgi:photosystem II stability/assembly factor-like uncharacterized protein
MLSPEASGGSSVYRVLQCVGVAVGLVLLGVLATACTDSDPEGPAAPPVIWPEGDLVGVAAVDQSTAIVIEESGEIYRSLDMGSTWARARVPAVEALTAIAMVDTQFGWAVGPGVVLRTEDGGETWRRQRLPGRSVLHRLHAIAALDRDTAIAAGEGGLLLSTIDGGSLWLDASPPSLESADSVATLQDVACVGMPRPICYAAGDRVIVSLDRGSSWSVVAIEDAANLAPFVFRLGGVELAAESITPLVSRVSGLIREDIEWIVEAFVSPAEIERFAGDRDPSALFELLEARAGEVRIALEAAGVESTRITLHGAPPWGYEDVLDDDPSLLLRYWETRRRDRPSAEVRTQEQLGLTSIAIGPSGQVAAVGLAGRFLESDGAGEMLFRRSAPTPHDLLDLAFASNAEVAVGRQGALITVRGDGGDDRRVDPPARVGGGAIFDTLRGVDFATTGEIGLVVGDQGRLLRTEDGGRTWGLITAPP